MRVSQKNSHEQELIPALEVSFCVFVSFLLSHCYLYRSRLPLSLRRWEEACAKRKKRGRRLRICMSERGRLSPVEPGSPSLAKPARLALEALLSLPFPTQWPLSTLFSLLPTRYASTTRKTMETNRKQLLAAPQPNSLYFPHFLCPRRQ